MSTGLQPCHRYVGKPTPLDTVRRLVAVDHGNAPSIASGNAHTAAAADDFALFAAVEAMTITLDTVRAVLADVPGEFDMIEHNPDEGMRAFCCGGDVHRKYAGGGGWTYHVGHASDCWYVRLVQLRDDLADNPEE